MSRIKGYFVLITLLAACAMPVLAGQPNAGNAAVPTLVNFSGTLRDASGKPLSGVVGVTFTLYTNEQGGSPLWLETQNVQVDSNGHYVAVLGATKSAGLPTNLFVSGEARWLGVQAQGQEEQPRVLLLSVPYALKAGDAQTIGGLPPSAFVLSTPQNSVPPQSSASGTTGLGAPALGGKGKTNYLPIWTNASTLGNSALFQTGKGSAVQVGIGTTKPASTLDVNGSGTIRGLFSLPATGTATSGAGFNSQPFDLAASAYNTGTNTAVLQTFQWQAQPVNNDTSNASGTLNLLFASGNGKPGQTGLNIASNGQITFAKGQTFPGTGNGTITGVTAGTDMTGGGTSGNVTLNVDTTKVVTAVKAGTDLTGGGTGGNLTLNLDTTKVPQLSTNNSFSGNQSITGNLSATGSITGQTGVFSGNNTTQVVNVTQSGTGSALVATTNGTTQVAAIQANASSSANGIGIEAVATGTQSVAMVGLANNATSGSGSVGIEGDSLAPNGAGVFGFSQDNTGSGMGVYASSASPNGVGARGVWSTTSSIGYGSAFAGVWGDSSSGYGVIGTSDDAAAVLAMSDFNVGVWGQGLNDIGVYGTGALGVTGYSGTYAGVSGEFGSASSSGTGFASAGTWGDSGCSSCFGVLGTTDDGNSLFGVNNTVNHETLYVENDSGFNGGTPLAARFAGPGSSTYCYFPRDSADNGSGDIVCTGTKSAAVPVEGNRMVRLYAVEAADNWFEDAGSGQLSNGSVAVALDRVFSETVNGNLDYHVFLTPNGDCEGLYVTNKTSHGFEVHELHGGHSNVAFDYRIMVRRKGFENVRMQDVTADFTQMKRESDQLASRLEAGKAAEKTHPKPRIPSPLPRKSSSAAPHAGFVPPNLSFLPGPNVQKHELKNSGPTSHM